MRMSRFSILSTFLAIGFTSCSNPNFQAFQDKLADDFGIFSTRPNNVKVVLTTVKLKSPALLTTAEKKNGRIKIKPEDLARLEKEQTEAIAELAKISKDIRVIFKLRNALNALVIAAPVEALGKIREMNSVQRVERSGIFTRPAPMSGEKISKTALDFSRNSVAYIGADKAHQAGLRGQGIRVGVIDTGIDYTHAMLGGSGNIADYENMDKSKPSSLFPNKKVVGGYDFVGTEYNAASEDSYLSIPTPDENPVDEGGHGSHVAGSVAGIGDGVNSYSGVAPEALLYSLKVFGADGSTSDGIVVAAFEYATDPNGDGDVNDRLDVVNLSLGSGYGNPHILYNEAIHNVTKAGMAVVASAGNSGNLDYIVGAPGVSDDSLSVAAGIDDSFHTWQFGAVAFHIGDRAPFLVESIESTLTKPIESIEQLEGRLVYAGLAAEDFSAELRDKIKGNVTLIDRGSVNFAEKIRRSQEAGAIGVVVANNAPGNPIVMGGDGKFEIPAIMVTQDIGATLKSALQSTEVRVNFKTTERIEKPELIGTITDFSSKGPRSVDSVLKPEITGPGYQIISADMGTGRGAKRLNGTSMSSPHLAGVMALMKQAHPELSVAELKSMVMGTAKTMHVSGKTYPLTRQGAGMVQAFEATQSRLASTVPAISLGSVGVLSFKKIPLSLPVKNLSDKDLKLQLSWKGSSSLSFEGLGEVELPAKSEKVLNLKANLDATKLSEGFSELDGYLTLGEGQVSLFRWPTLAVVQRLASTSVSDLIIEAGSDEDAYGAAASLMLKNSSGQAARALLFNLLGTDERKPFVDDFTSRECDLQMAGYRIVQKNSQDVLQIAVKTYRSMTTWHMCEVSVLIDTDQDGVPEQEIVGVPGSRLPGGQGGETFVSYLLDSPKARDLRRQFETDVVKDPALKENYSTAVQNVGAMQVFNKSSVAVVEAPLKMLKRGPQGSVFASIVLAHGDYTSTEEDDYLARSKVKPFVLPMKSADQAFVGLSDITGFTGEKKVNFAKGGKGSSVLVLFPDNAFRLDEMGWDQQAAIVKAKFANP